MVNPVGVWGEAPTMGVLKGGEAPFIIRKKKMEQRERTGVWGEAPTTVVKYKSKIRNSSSTRAGSDIRGQTQSKQLF